jgi:outer membrane murein-binding lipoprotein Lpp
MRTIWVILLTVIVAGGLSGGGAYYYVLAKAATDKNNLQTQIDSLNKQVTSLNSQILTAKSVKSATVLNTNIEKVDFSKIITVNTKLGDQLLAPAYADLNNDNSEEALVVYKYGGTGSLIDFYIYGLKNGTPIQLFKQTNLYGGSISIKDGAVYVDYTNLNSTINQGKPNSDLTTDTHIKFTWNGSIFEKSNQ